MSITMFQSVNVFIIVMITLHLTHLITANYDDFSSYTDYDDAPTSDQEDHADYEAPDFPPPMPDAQMLRSQTGFCANQSISFCEDVPNYPAAHIERQLNVHPERYAELFGTELVLDDRFAAESVPSRPMCRSRETIIYPKKGLTAANTWMYIVNFKHYVQGIRVEMCERSGGSCDWPARHWPLGMRPVCRQKYIFRQLLAIDVNGRTVVDYFRMPCCCNCVMAHQTFGRY